MADCQRTVGSLIWLDVVLSYLGLVSTLVDLWLVRCWALRCHYRGMDNHGGARC
jgi:hypothetical protein